jgi:pimeloyl-ACP methyl ester carboxylesterase
MSRMELQMGDQIRAEWVSLPSPTGWPQSGWGANPTQGIYYTPKANRPKVALIATHYNLDFTEHYLGPLMAERGIGFLGWNTRFRGAEALFLVDHAVAEIGAGVKWLKETAGVETVVLLGNSGGGSLMATYQGHAQHGSLKPFEGGKLCRGLDDLISGDLYVSLAAHPGRADLIAFMMDPSVTDEFDPLSCDPSLDMYNPENGPPYSQEFQARYREAQLARSSRITAWVKAELKRLNDANIRDRYFSPPRLWADLRFTDGSMDPSNRVVPGCFMGDPERANQGVTGIGQVSTLRTWLSMWSLEDSQCRGEIHLPGIEVPSLVIGADGDVGCFPSHTEEITALIGSKDKESMTLPGDHYFRGDGTREHVADVLTDWITRHPV